MDGSGVCGGRRWKFVSADGDILKGIFCRLLCEYDSSLLLAIQRSFVDNFQPTQDDDRYPHKQPPPKQLSQSQPRINQYNSKDGIQSNENGNTPHGVCLCIPCKIVPCVEGDDLQMLYTLCSALISYRSFYFTHRTQTKTG